MRIDEATLLQIALDTALEGSSCRGYLVKKGGISGKWQQRWFVLASNFLFYYENENLQQRNPLGVIFLEKCMVVIGRDEPNSYSFHIQGPGNSRRYELSADTPVSRKLWVDALQHARMEPIARELDELRNEVLQYKSEAETCRADLQKFKSQFDDTKKGLFILKRSSAKLMRQQSPTTDSALSPRKTRNFGDSSPKGALTPTRPIESAEQVGGVAAPTSAHQQEGATGATSAAIVEGAALSGEGTAESQTKAQAQQDKENSANELFTMDEIMQKQFEENHVLEAPDVALLDEMTSDEMTVVKIQSFVRTWLCARRWRSALRKYVHTEDAQTIRKRNHVIRQLHKDEKTYLEVLETIAKHFLKPLKLSAESTHPILQYSDIAQIFLNIETIQFAHQLFFSRLDAQLENWPSVQLGDTFLMLAPILSIYTDYLRNIQHCLGHLARVKNQSPAFAKFVSRAEQRLGSSLEALLVVPMNQVPRYADQMRELVSLTPNDHIERTKLTEARDAIASLAISMRERTSKTENLRHMLHVERQLCDDDVVDLLLVPGMRYVREGVLTIPNTSTSLFGSDPVQRDCFLLSGILLVTARVRDGLTVKERNCAVIPLVDAVVDDINPEYGSHTPPDTQVFATTSFSIAWKGQSLTLATLTASSKYSWLSDLMACIEHCKLSQSQAKADESNEGSATSVMLFQDSVDVQFSDSKGPDGVPYLRAATIDRVFDVLLPDGSWWPTVSYHALDYLNSFLLIYRCIMDANEVLGRLKHKFFNHAPGVAGDLLCQRVFGVLHQWVTKFYLDFDSDDNLKQAYVQFLSLVQEQYPIYAGRTQTLIRLLDIQRGEAERMKALTGAIVFITATPLSADMAMHVTSIPPQVLAEQLTYIESTMFQAIQVNELIGQAWSKKNKQDRAPNVLRLISHFNTVGQWVATMVLQEDASVRRRAQVIYHFLRVAAILKEMRNFNGVMEVVAGLSKSAVHRLKRSWNEIPADRLKIFNSLKQLSCPDGNFKTLRSTIQAAPYPNVPYLGMYLTDLTFIDDGNQDFIEVERQVPDLARWMTLPNLWEGEDTPPNTSTLPSGNENNTPPMENSAEQTAPTPAMRTVKTKLVNMNKARLQAGVLEAIRRAQLTPYTTLSPNPDVMRHVMLTPALPDDKAYTRSLEIEPRQPC